MSQDDAQPDMPAGTLEDAGPAQPADSIEPEAPAHVDPDPETAAHRDDEATVDGADPSPPQPS